MRAAVESGPVMAAWGAYSLTARAWSGLAMAGFMVYVMWRPWFLWLQVFEGCCAGEGCKQGAKAYMKAAQSAL